VTQQADRAPSLEFEHPHGAESARAVACTAVCHHLLLQVQAMPGKAKSEARIVVLLVDGMADVALPQLDDCTPLQVADTPMLDAIAGAALSK
jgi:hypothetical protein